MPYDPELEARIQAATAGWPATDRKQMFGGVCHLLRGNMFCGVWRDHLVLRLGEAGAPQALARPRVRPFGVTGRPMKGWVMVEPEGIGDDRSLAAWLDQARAFAEHLPPK